jgi:hypothetical protein
MGALEDALLRGALAGEVAPDELQEVAALPARQHPVEELLGALRRARRGEA